MPSKRSIFANKIWSKLICFNLSDDFNVVRQPGKTGRLEVDFTKAKVGNLSTMEITDQTFMDYLAANDQKVFKKWSEYQEEAIETFMERWNDAKKKVIKLTKKDTPDYIIKINAAQLDPGNSGAATWSWNKRGGGIIISGTLEVIDAAGNSVCKMNINRYRGFSTRGLDIKIPTFHRRTLLLHKSLAKDLLEFLFDK